MKSAPKAAAAQRSIGRRDRNELAFLPAALEIVETPPSPTARASGAVVMLFFCAALAWAALGKIDIIASATGKIVPGDRVKLIQPLEIGVVRSIRVRDGQTVKAGEVLVELDPTVNEAELQHLRSDLLAASLDVSRNRAALAGNTDLLDDLPEGTPSALIDMHREFLRSQEAEQRAKLAELERQRAQKEAERNTIEASLAKTEALIPVLQERVSVRKYLADKELGSKLQYLTELQELIGLQHDLLVQRSRLDEAKEAAAALDETRSKVASEYRHHLFDDLAKATQKVASLSEDVLKSEHRTNLQTLTAPIDGVVQQLAIHTIGGVVTPAQTLAVIVPTDDHVEIEAAISNRDIGFVHAGQEAQIKIDTFNFTRYGLLHGKILSVSSDSVVREKKDSALDASASTGAANTSSEPRGQELLYVARVSLDQTTMMVEDREMKLFPGMAVTAEIKTGSRTIISYLLSPLVRYRQGALRER
ncbi:HlyD family type I secretion periplasmic adaptor subunit [Bradyrhizobium sp. CCBAU 51627]|uniref:HlyD family type I secretion periplasmic adaptor subunit n=1 Tax=Bradyrhizobium sp. CCBAU 51627 TaxID=1325088 RepID=UPI002305CF13|nr:HlyD family type I secretion periplasmic adaptor subunit [Bradyrhizobium sp. CCBAU 51627]MDA9431619.1 hemolysin secretion protein D [Bradyrhizobium sp. CCBAU 51627]